MDDHPVGNSYSVSSKTPSDSSPVPPQATTSPSSGIRLRLIRDQNASSLSAYVTATNEPSLPIVRPTPTKERKQSRMSVAQCIRPMTTKGKAPRNFKKEPISKRKTVHMPACYGLLASREQLLKLPEREGDDNLYVGDIFFGKMTGYPWWPCMITVDPQTRLYSKLHPEKQPGSSEKPERSYHVQYFGPKVYRGYVPPKFLKAFEGREKYENEVDRIKNTPGTPKAQRKAALQKLTIPQVHKSEWRKACDEAEDALKLDLEERLKEYTFDYVISTSLSPPSENLPKRKEESSNPLTPKAKKSRKSSIPNPLEVYDFNEAEEEFEDGQNNSLTLMWKKRPERKGDFSVFCARSRDQYMKSNPNATKEEIDQLLEKQWSYLSEDYKAKYVANSSREESDAKQQEPEPLSNKTTKRSYTKRASIATPRAKKPRSEDLEGEGSQKSNGEVVTNSNNITNNSKHGESSDEESALVIAETLPKRARARSKIKSEKDMESKVESEEPVVVAMEKKSAKAPKTPRKVGRPPKNVDGDLNCTPKAKSEMTSNGSTIKAKKRQQKDDSLVVSARKRGPAKQELSLEKTPKKIRKQSAGKEGFSDLKKDSSKGAIRKHINSVSIPPLPPMDSEETFNSEDASSLSEIENGESKKPLERVCETCHEKVDDKSSLVQCSGTCLRVYHTSEKCLPDDFDCKTNQCIECLTGNHKCLICHIHTDEAKKCSDPHCGRHYHIKCLQNNYPHRMVKDEANESFICPSHFCLTCYVEHQDDQVHNYMKKRILRCLECPIAYHWIDNCIAAGSVFVSTSLVICPEHVQSKSGRHVNVNWCFSCNTGGNLVCCDRCPAAFHSSCLEIEPPEGKFFCGDCIVRRQLHYNDIVWVKLGNFRWWPGRVCHPKVVPDNVMKLSHSMGEFPVYFFGSHDYYWIHRGRAFPFVEGDLAKAPSLAKGKDKQYQLALKEAQAAFEEWQTLKKNELNNRKLKPPPYVPLRTNKRVGKSKSTPTAEEESSCNDNMCSCKADDDNSCGDDTECFNRLTMIECDQNRCQAGEKCKNRRFRKREYAKVQPFRTEDRGWGLKANEDIKKGQFVIEYVGELIDETECEARIQSMVENNETNFYFLTIDKDNIIDAGPKGNLARFMNHSCDPNCETQKWVVNGATRVGLFAKYDIPSGAELTFNYNLHCRGNELTKCGCGAKNCSGFLGMRPSKPTLDDGVRKLPKLEVKKKKSESKALAKRDFDSFHDDFCFKCGEGGELIMCDKKQCPKSYHLACLDLEKLPRGQWWCPWHHCDECGQKSAKMCSLCPTSFCNEHGENLLSKNEHGDLVCYSHSDVTPPSGEIENHLSKNEPTPQIDNESKKFDDKKKPKERTKEKSRDKSTDKPKEEVEDNSKENSLDQIKKESSKNPVKCLKEEVTTEIDEQIAEKPIENGENQPKEEEKEEKEPPVSPMTENLQANTENKPVSEVKSTSFEKQTPELKGSANQENSDSSEKKTEEEPTVVDRKFDKVDKAEKISSHVPPANTEDVNIPLTKIGENEKEALPPIEAVKYSSSKPAENVSNNGDGEQDSTTEAKPISEDKAAEKSISNQLAKENSAGERSIDQISVPDSVSESITKLSSDHVKSCEEIESPFERTVPCLEKNGKQTIVKDQDSVVDAGIPIQVSDNGNSLDGHAPEEEKASHKDQPLHMAKSNDPDLSPTSPPLQSSITPKTANSGTTNAECTN